MVLSRWRAQLYFRFRDWRTSGSIAGALMALIGCSSIRSAGLVAKQRERAVENELSPKRVKSDVLRFLIAKGYPELDQGRDEDAMKTFQAVEAVKDYEGLHHLGGYHMLRGELDEAERHYERAKAIEDRRLAAGARDEDLITTAIHTLHDLAHLYSLRREKGRIEGLLPRIRELVGRMNPPRATELNRWAQAHLFLDQKAEAEVLFARAAGSSRAVPQDLIEANAQLAQLRRGEGKYDDAEAIYRRILSTQVPDADYLWVKCALAGLLLNHGREQEGQSMLQAVLLETNNRPADFHRLEALMTLGDYDARSNRPIEAQSHYELIIRALGDRPASPQKGRALEALAILHAGRGNIEVAKKLYRQAIEVAKASTNQSEVDRLTEALAGLLSRPDAPVNEKAR